MGFFKKIFKGVGKVFKKIGRGIKKAVGKFGKFMGKAGILGQVAMMFILPGIGQALGSAFTGLIGTAGTATTAGTGLLGGGALSQAAGKVLQFAGKVASAPGKIFSSITKGVTSTLTEFSKTALSKMGFEGKLVEGAAESYFFGADSAASRVGTAIKSPFTEKALLDAATETADEALTSTVDASDVVETVTDKVAKPDPLIDQSLMTPSPTPPDMDALAQQKENYVEKTVRDITTTAQETVESKMESLSDPMKVAETSYNIYKDRQAEEELAAQQAAMQQGYVTNVGIYQDPSSFMTTEFQNTIAPIQTLQPMSNYSKPVSSWSQQFMFNPFEMQQQMRTV
jgi:hypothetical protein